MSRSRWQPGSVDLALEYLRGYLRGHQLPYRWHEIDLSLRLAVCPACGAGDWTLQIREHGHHGQIALVCRSGCTAGEIRAALEGDPLAAERDRALELADHCAAVAREAVELLAWVDGRTVGPRSKAAR